jgi:3-phenylpropionate/trans-cinnamate dioxygenase ferredoxin reductase subunit
MVIVGAGQAGGRAALTLRDLGHDGPIVLLGAEAAAPYERPPLSKAFLTGEREAAEFTFASADVLAAAGIEFRPACRVAAIDRASRTVRFGSGERLAYGKLLLATGRRARRLPLPTAVADRVHYLRDLGDARRLMDGLAGGRHLLVVGGGFIGLEVAASAVSLGCRVTVVDVAPRVLSRIVPPPLATLLQARHEAAGVAIRLGTGIERVANAGDRLLATLTDGSALEIDLMLVGIGAVPRTELAEAAGLRVDHEVAVDATLATSDPDIFAAGDVCAWPDADGTGLIRLESWQNAEAQGALAARNMLGAGEAYAVLPWFWSEQYELTLQIAGRPELPARTVARAVGADGRLLFHLDRGDRPIGVSGVGPAAFAREFKLARLLLERGAPCERALLADPAAGLKALLR